MSISKMEEMTTEDLKEKIFNLGEGIIEKETKIGKLNKELEKDKSKLEIYRREHGIRVKKENGFKE